MDKICEIEVKNVYGNEMIYPANEVARIFSRISGKKTLSKSDLISISELGFKLVVMVPELVIG